MDRNGIIGRDNALPWRLPEDLKHFKAVTMGKPMLMGRRTFESIGRALPGRTNVVLTRDRSWQAPPDVLVAHCLESALRAVGDAPELAVIGGAEIFALLLPQCSRIYLTEVHADVHGDTRFPALAAAEWREVERREYAADARNLHALTFVTLERTNARQRSPQAGSR